MIAQEVLDVTVATDLTKHSGGDDSWLYYGQLLLLVQPELLDLCRARRVAERAKNDSEAAKCTHPLPPSVI